jgi:uroporphyrinogen decarboxylase
MKRNMKQWLDGMIQSQTKKPIPILSFPAVQLLGVTVRDLISDSGLQARGMKAVADRVQSGAAVGLMDLSLEAECFGAEVHFSDDEVPTVVGCIIKTEEDAEKLAVPEVGAGRTRVYIDAVRAATEIITDRPVFAGVIGPFSLAGRLCDVTEIMVQCYDEPDMVHTVLEKVTRFLTDYAKEYKQIGANGVIIAEPLAGLLSPALAAEFSCGYVKRIVDAVQDDGFMVIYHNCGNYTPHMIDEILAIGAMAVHLGNAVSMEAVLAKIPADVPLMGNIDPVAQFRNGTPESMRSAVDGLLRATKGHQNFILSSGCDIPPLAKWENIDAFFEAAK